MKPHPMSLTSCYTYTVDRITRLGIDMYRGTLRDGNGTTVAVVNTWSQTGAVTEMYRRYYQIRQLNK